MYRIILIALLFTSLQFAQTAWHTLSSGTTMNLRDLLLTDSVTAFAVGDGGVILKTTDRGQTWSTKHSSQSLSLNSICFRTVKTGIAAGYGDSILYTTNSGESWQGIKLPYRANFQSCALFGSVIILGKEVGGFLQSTDWGDSWVEHPMNIYSCTVYFDKPNEKLYIATDRAIFVSLDSGTTMQKIPDVQFAGELSKIKKDIVTGKFLGAGFDGDLPIFPMLLLPYNGTGNLVLKKVMRQWDLSFVDIAVVAEDKHYYVERDGGIYVSPDSGDHIYAEYSRQYGAVSRVDFFDKNYGIAIGKSGLIMFRDPLQSISKLPMRPKNNSIDIYPNPCNPTAKINIQLEAQSSVQVYIYTVHGELLETVFSGELPQGVHTIPWSGIVQPTGVYLAVVQIDGQVLTQKLLLLK